MPMINDWSQISDLTGRIKSGRESLLSGQQSQWQDLYNKYKAGIDPIQGQISGYNKQLSDVQGLINNLDQNIASQVKGTFTTQGGADRLKAAQLKPLTQEESQIGLAMTPLTQQLGFAQQDYSIQAQGQADYFARQITGYTTDSQNELTALTQKIERDQAMSDAEWKRANDLADAESSFQHQKDLIWTQASASSSYAQPTDTQVKEQAQSALVGDIQSYLKQGPTRGNVDPNSPESQDFFNTLYSKFGQYGLTPDVIRSTVSSIYGNGSFYNAFPSSGGGSW